MIFYLNIFDLTTNDYTTIQLATSGYYDEPQVKENLKYLRLPVIVSINSNL